MCRWVNVNFVKNQIQTVVDVPQEQNYVGKQLDNYTVLAIKETLEAKNAGWFAEEDLNGKLVKLKTSGETITAITDSGSPVSFLNEHLAAKLKQTVKGAILKHIPTEDATHNLACYHRVYIEPLYRLIILIESGG